MEQQKVRRQPFKWWRPQTSHQDAPTQDSQDSQSEARSGCIPCKIRRIECDERKPTCVRCEKADVECHGYTEEFFEEGKSADEIEVMKFIQVCQDEMRQFAVNIQSLKRKYYDQPPVLAEINLYDGILVDIGSFARALDHRSYFLDYGVTMHYIRCAADPIIAFNTSFDKLDSNEKGESYFPISFMKTDATAGRRMEDLIFELGLRRNSIVEGLRACSTRGTLIAVLDEHLTEKIRRVYMQRKLDAKRDDWSDRDSQSDASSWSADSIFTGVQSASTQSSLPHMGVYALREKLTSLIIEDAEITRIYVAGLGDKSVDREDVTRALRSRLRKFGKQLGQRSGPEQQACAKVIRRGARYISEAVRRKHDPEYREMQPHVNNTAMTDEEKNRYIVRMIEESRGSTTEQPTETRELDLDSDSSGDDEDELDTQAILLRRMKEVEESIWSHPSMAWFKGSLASFVVDRHNDKSFLQNLSRKPSMPELVDRWWYELIDRWWYRLIPRLRLLYRPRPPVPAGANRITWTCECGLDLFDDYVELKEGGLKDIKDSMGVRKVIGTASAPPESQSTRLPSPGAWPGAIIDAVKGAFERTPSAGIPAPNRIGAPLPPQGSINPGQRQILYLLCCMQAGDRGYGRRLHQALTPFLHNDGAFFALLRSIYYANRKMRSRFTLRAVSEVGHCKMMVDFSDYASVDKHSHSCVSEPSPSCNCWPPQDLIGTEYTCAAGTSPGTSPAVGPNYLLHYFEHPDHLRPGQKLLIRYVPLKMGARLAAGEDEMKAGWGLYFEEGWHLKTICVVLSALMLVTSLVFAVTWTVVKGDIQGGFGVASYWATAMTVVLMVLGTLANRSF